MFFNIIQSWIDAGKPLNSFICGDCMEGLKHIDKMDLAIVDPPYGIKPSSNFGQRNAIRFNKNDVEWDIKPNNYYFDELNRVSINSIIWGGNYFALPACRCFIIWDKENGKNPFADCEFAWTSFNNSARIFRYFWLGSHIHKKEDVIHPTQKPVALYRWLLQNYAKPGDKILDTHTGSASSLIACEIEGFKYIGFEKDPDYFRDACKRIEQHRLKTIDLFKPEETKPSYKQSTFL